MKCDRPSSKFKYLDVNSIHIFNILSFLGLVTFPMEPILNPERAFQNKSAPDTRHNFVQTFNLRLKIH